MSIGKRLIDLAKSELNSLLDRAADANRDDGDIDALSDEQLEAELERRRRVRQEADREAKRRAEEAQRSSATRAGSTGGAGARDSGGAARRPPTPQDAIRKAYAALEVPPGSDFATVRTAYRTLMRKYHPDRHAQSPEKQKTAHELAQKLTESYKTLEKQLRK